VTAAIGPLSHAARVSAICTVRDEARHVHAALSSVLTGGVTQVVVVDDGSTDATPIVLQELAAADCRVNVVTSPPIGRGAAITAAVRIAHGDFLVNVDADDAIHPEWIRVGTSILECDPTMAVVAASPRYVGEGQAVRWQGLGAIPAARNVTAHLAFYNPIVHSSAIMRRAAIESVGGYDIGRRFHFDYDLWIRLARAGWIIGAVNAPLVAKRLHRGQKFEIHNRLPYLRSSAMAQAQAIHAVDAGSAAWVAMGGRLLWGLMPRFVRMAARRLLADGHRSSLLVVHSARGDFKRAHAPISSLGSEHRRQSATNKQ
jgi:glycosyltransferase involved in cell wall biosynthesis